MKSKANVALYELKYDYVNKEKEEEKSK